MNDKQLSRGDGIRKIISKISISLGQIRWDPSPDFLAPLVKILVQVPNFAA